MILVTGITGKSGTWFLKRLIREKEDLKNTKFRVVVRNTSNVELIDRSGLSIEKVYGDLHDASFAEEAMENVSTVLHIAGIHTSLNVVKAAIKHDVNRLILVHTTGIYSKYKSASFQYIETERRIEEMTANRNIDVTILRPTMIYGSISDNNVIVFIKMVDKLKLFPVINHARYPLQPVHEKDLGEAYYQVLFNPEKTRNKNYNLSGKEPILLIDMLKTIGFYLGKKNVFISIPFPVAYVGALFLYGVTAGKIDFRERVQRMVEPRTFSHDEASRDFGYSPVGFKEGITKEIDEYVTKKYKKTTR
ncbi:MAG: NAD-dependent epimerase/dehydratase family protein [Bacteroidota bacterium]